MMIMRNPQGLTRAKKSQSRREREIWKQFLQFREEKEKSEFPFPSFEREREIKKNILNFREEKEKSEKNILNTREEKEKSKFFAQASRGEREI